MNVSLKRIALPEVPFADLDQRADRTIFQTRAWLDFLVESQQAEPVVAEVRDGSTAVGWFTGAIVRRHGARILGSPMRGWTTSYMGFNLDQPERWIEAVAALRSFAFDDLGCVHLELMDRASPKVAPAGFAAGVLPGYELDLRADDEVLLSGMTSHGRRDVRRAERNEISVEEVDPVAEPDFGREYYDQVTSAFAKRSLSPTFPIERVESMIRHLHPTGRLVLLRSRDRAGAPAATGIFPGLAGSSAVYWMGASRRDLQPLLPNEALMWHALRTWRDRGAVRFDFGGGGSYKAKYGGAAIEVPWLRTSRFAVIEHGRAVALRLVRQRQRFGAKAHP